MIEFNIFNFYKQVKDENILISFKGALSQEILVEMGDFIKGKVSMDRKIKKIFAVFVELAQNIMHYSIEREIVEKRTYGIGVIIFAEDDKCYNIYSGNLIGGEDIKKVCEKLDYINSLTPDELKEVYTEQRKKPHENGSKGAGLGLYEIARKSTGRIEYGISKFDDKDSFLGLKVQILKGDNDG